jgi:hypothetical protein
VRLEWDEDRVDPYNRLLAYVHADDIFRGGEVMLNAELLREGLAQLYIVQPNTRHEDLLRAAQEKAKAEAKETFAYNIWTLSQGEKRQLVNEKRQLVNHGNGIGSSEGSCPPKEQFASPNPNPDPSSDRNRERNRRIVAPSVPAQSAPPAPGGGVCEPPAYWVGPGGPGDGDEDGCANE